MKIRVIDKKNNINKIMNVKSILEVAEKLNIIIDEIIILKNNQLTTEDSKIKEGDIIEFLCATSAG